MKQVSVWQTSDGKTFETKREAGEHEAVVIIGEKLAKTLAAFGLSATDVAQIAVALVGERSDYLTTLNNIDAPVKRKYTRTPSSPKHANRISELLSFFEAGKGLRAKDVQRLRGCPNKDAHNAVGYAKRMGYLYRESTGEYFLTKDGIRLKNGKKRMRKPKAKKKKTVVAALPIPIVDVRPEPQAIYEFIHKSPHHIATAEQISTGIGVDIGTVLAETTKLMNRKLVNKVGKDKFQTVIKISDGKAQVTLAQEVFGIILANGGPMNIDAIQAKIPDVELRKIHWTLSSLCNRTKRIERTEKGVYRVKGTN